MTVNHTPPPTNNKYDFGVAMGIAPATLSFSPAPDVMYLHPKPGSLLRERNASLLLSSFKMSQDILYYFLKHYDRDLLILIQGPSPRLIKQLVNVFVGPSTIPDNPPPLSPLVPPISHH